MVLVLLVMLAFLSCVSVSGQSAAEKYYEVPDSGEQLHSVVPHHIEIKEGR